MPAAEDENVVELTGDETRCLIGLKNYYVRIEAKTDEEATNRAWEDLKNERDRKSGELCFPRLQSATWFK